jgi:hypothetical protein
MCSNDPALQDLVRTSMSRTETTEYQDPSNLDIPDLLKNLLQLLSEDGVLYLSTNEENAIRLITLLDPIVPFLCHHLRDGLLSIRTEHDSLNWILKYVETDQRLCKVPSWKWNLLLSFLHKNSQNI